MSETVRSYSQGFREILFHEKLWSLSSLFVVLGEADCFDEAKKGEFQIFR